jgi:tetratricopeptide (TPR) repeat protein
MRYKTVPLLGFALLFMVTAVCSSLSPAETAFNRGVDYYEQGDYRKAIEEYDETIRLSLLTVEKYMTEAHRGELSRRLDPKYPLAHNHRGLAYGKLGEYERAIEDFDETIRLDPQNANAYHNRGLAYEKLGQQKLADRDFARARELGYNP